MYLNTTIYTTFEWKHIAVKKACLFKVGNMKKLYGEKFYAWPLTTELRMSSNSASSGFFELWMK